MIEIDPARVSPDVLRLNPQLLGDLAEQRAFPGRRKYRNTPTEADFQAQVIALARTLGWTVAHFRAVRVQRADGSVHYCTPVQADGAGWPDLILVRPPRIVAAELKVCRNTLSQEQDEWLRRLSMSGVETWVWYPAMWADIETVLRRDIAEVD